MTRTNFNSVMTLLNPVITKQNNLFGESTDRDLMKTKYGYVPSSIFDVDWKKTKELKAYVGDTGKTRIQSNGIVNIQGKGVSASIFNPYLTMSLLKAYAPKCADIYDPFAGGGTRAIISAAMGHNYTGCEIRQDEVDVVNERKMAMGLSFLLVCGDARGYVDEEAFNFSLTCPPYYNLEKYDGGEDDLSMMSTYESFMDSIGVVMDNVYKSLKPGSFSIWVVGNFRDKDKNVVDFHGDVIRAAQDSGFGFHDDIVFHNAPGNALQRAGVFEANKRSTKIHEYILVFKKPY